MTVHMPCRAWKVVCLFVSLQAAWAMHRGRHRLAGQATESPLPTKSKLLTTVTGTSNVQDELTPPTTCKSVVLVHYHKTGCRVSQRLIQTFYDVWKWSSVTLENTTNRRLKYATIYKSFLEEDTPLSKSTIARVSNPGTGWQVPEGSCVVHWYRDPTDLLLSSYRYHTSKTYAEPWEYDNRTCHRCDGSSGEYIFSACPDETSKCTYYDMLTGLSEHQGVEYDAVMEREMLRQMTGNFHRWRNEPNVLHLSMEHLSANTTSTIGCILNFLNRSGTKASTFSQKAILTLAHKSHPTSGLYDNTELQAFLEGHEAWGSELIRTRRAPLKVFKRQRSMYGCPVPGED